MVAIIMRVWQRKKQSCMMRKIPEKLKIKSNHYRQSRITQKKKKGKRGV